MVADGFSIVEITMINNQQFVGLQYSSQYSETEDVLKHLFHPEM
jgi:hypothetical protein